MGIRTLAQVILPGEAKLNNLKIEHIGTETLPKYGDWTCSEFENWLHPLNGPEPDQVYLLECVNETFRVAIWHQANYLISVTEILDRPRSQAETETAAKFRGWILDCRRWSKTEDGLQSGEVLVMPPDRDVDDSWEEEFSRSVAAGAVTLAVTTNMGDYYIGEPDECPTSSYVASAAKLRTTYSR